MLQLFLYLEIHNNHHMDLSHEYHLWKLDVEWASTSQPDVAADKILSLRIWKIHRKACTEYLAFLQNCDFEWRSKLFKLVSHCRIQQCIPSYCVRKKLVRKISKCKPALKGLLYKITRVLFIKYYLDKIKWPGDSLDQQVYTAYLIHFKSIFMR